MRTGSTSWFMLLLAGAVPLACGDGAPTAGGTGDTAAGAELRGDGRHRGEHHRRRGHHARRHGDHHPEDCEPEAATYAVGGSVTGLAGTLGLHEASAGDLTLLADGPFRFPVALPDGATYAVAIATQPAGQACTLANGDGTIVGADVSDVAVTCTPLPPPPPVAGGTPDGTFGAGGKVTTDFSGAPPAGARAPIFAGSARGRTEP